MLIARAPTYEERLPRLLILHGPPNVDASAALRERAVTLHPDDILIIAEHDLAESVRLEQRAAPRRPRAAEPAPITAIAWA
jgi:hypothetical protein